jgi:hypothetical protein
VVANTSIVVTAATLFVSMKMSTNAFHFFQVNARLSSCVEGELLVLKIQQYLKTSVFAGAIYSSG